MIRRLIRRWLGVDQVEERVSDLETSLIDRKGSVNISEVLDSEDDTRDADVVVLNGNRNKISVSGIDGVRDIKVSQGERNEVRLSSLSGMDVGDVSVEGGSRNSVETYEVDEKATRPVDLDDLDLDRIRRRRGRF